MSVEANRAEKHVDAHPTTCTIEFKPTSYPWRSPLPSVHVASRNEDLFAELIVLKTRTQILCFLTSTAKGFLQLDSCTNINPALMLRKLDTGIRLQSTQKPLRSRNSGHCFLYFHVWSDPLIQTYNRWRLHAKNRIPWEALFTNSHLCPLLYRHQSSFLRSRRFALRGSSFDSNHARFWGNNFTGSCSRLSIMKIEAGTWDIVAFRISWDAQKHASLFLRTHLNAFFIKKENKGKMLGLGARQSSSQKTMPSTSLPKPSMRFQLRPCNVFGKMPTISSNSWTTNLQIGYVHLLSVAHVLMEPHERVDFWRKMSAAYNKEIIESSQKKCEPKRSDLVL